MKHRIDFQVISIGINCSEGNFDFTRFFYVFWKSTRAKILYKFSFIKGGSGATPTMNHDSTRLYASDDMNRVIALDSDLNFLWEVDLGSKVLASIAASQDNNELYAATEFDIFKIIDHGIYEKFIVTKSLIFISHNS